MKNFSLGLLLMLSFAGQRVQAFAIIGSDDRTQVLSLDADPTYRSIGHIIIEHPKKRSTCTGTLISPRHVLTNGHCVTISKKFPSPIVDPEDLTFVLGRLNSSKRAQSSYRIVRIEASAYMDSGSQDSDLAVLELDRPTGLPFLKLVSFRNPEVLKDRTISVTGYGGRTADGTLWNGQGVITGFVDLQSFTHSADTLPGQSGSIVRLRHNNEWVGVGIHRGSTFNLRGALENRGVLFNQSILTAIRDWIRD